MTNEPASPRAFCWDPIIVMPGSRMDIFQVIERLRFTFTPNSKREFVSSDQVFPLIVVNYLFLQLKNSSFTPVLYIRIVLDICLFSILRNSQLESDVCRLAYAWILISLITLAGRPGEWTKPGTGQRVTHCSCALLPRLLWSVPNCELYCHAVCTWELWNLPLSWFV